MYLWYQKGAAWAYIASALNIPIVGIYRKHEEHISAWGPKSTKSAVVKSTVLDDNDIEGFSIEETVRYALNFLS